MQSIQTPSFLPVRPVEVEGVRGQGPGQVRVRVDQARRAGRARARLAAARVTVVRACLGMEMEKGLLRLVWDAGVGVDVSAGVEGGWRRR
jgi:hypothetical protein